MTDALETITESSETVTDPLEALAAGFSVQEAAEYTGLSQRSIRNLLWEDRERFLEEKGLDKILAKRGNRTTGSWMMQKNYDHWSDICSGIVPVADFFNKNPGMLYRDTEKQVIPISELLFDLIEIAPKKIIRNVDLYAKSVDFLLDNYAHWGKRFGDVRAKKMVNEAPQTLRVEIPSLESKITVYRSEYIDFHQNYNLLTKNPLNVVKTRDLLSAYGVFPSQDGKTYYMLLGHNVETVRPKVEYCEEKRIPWRDYPQILISGLGTEKKPGALRRRVGMIDEVFEKTGSIPDGFDYREDARVLSMSDENLKDSLSLY